MPSRPASCRTTATPTWDPLSLVLETDPQHGSLEIFGDGFFLYIPDANYHGPDEFSYRVFDGRGESAVAKVLLTIASINDAPAAFDLAASTTEDEAVAGQVAGSDVDGDVLSFALAADP